MRLRYLSGFGGHFESEAVPGALPRGQNSPQLVPFALYAEQLSGTAFTAPRSINRRVWMYRLDPSVKHSRHLPRAHAALQSDFTGTAGIVAADQLRWRPLPLLPGAVGGEGVDWLDGLVTMCGAGSAESKEGLAIHLYAFNAGMRARRRAFSNADGDLLIVPQHGALLVTTELGRLEVEPGEVVVVQRNITFAVDAAVCGEGASSCRGYVLETFYAAHLAPAERGPVGANGLAEERDFLHPTAWYEDITGAHVVTVKTGGRLFERARSHSPFDVVAWHGNYAPFKYDLARFRAVNSVTVDHTDPSVFTVLTLPSAEPGSAAVDFAIFPPRWMCAERTFRPPYFHRNCMAEFMGLIHGGYDAKVGFVAGGSSLHNIGTPHGPDEASYRAAIEADTSTPAKFAGGTAFMFETRAPLRLSGFAADEGTAIFDTEYRNCWDGLPRAVLPANLEHMEDGAEPPRCA
ncbi:hypothetical protein KFE25_007703 [Diacronema lutheri]|uniref:homogentisate 1,2-dioxygenase n=2 Tax=Diacronema lutheri TaxID=2081491 RepID=A0A8J5XWD9_DIALT|nr:hypothetical protein KFE25_007703 [Diacronema lutheri]